MDALSVQETYFWREIDQMQGLACQRPAGAAVATYAGSADPHLERSVRDAARNR